MKSGLSGNITNEMEVSEWEKIERENALRTLNRFKQLEKEKPKKLVRVGNTIQTEGFQELLIKKKIL